METKETKETKKTDYNKVSKKKDVVKEPINKLNETTVENNIAAEPPKKPKKVKARVLANGVSLNLRESPNVSSRVLTIMPPGSELTIEDDKDKDFYRVTWHGIEGYAMKKFIEK